MRTMTAMVGGIALLGAGAVVAADGGIRNADTNELGPYYLEGMFDHYFADVVPDVPDREIRTAAPGVGDVGEGLLGTTEEATELRPYANEHMVAPWFGTLGMSYEALATETAAPAVGSPEGAITGDLGREFGGPYSNEHMIEPYFDIGGELPY